MGNTTGPFRTPGFSFEAADYLADNGVRCLGSDAYSTDPGIEKFMGIDNTHNAILGKGGIILELMNNNDLVHNCGAWLSIGAPKMSGSSGAQVRLFGFNPERECPRVDHSTDDKVNMW